jgi:hypothetical protein
MITPDGVYFLTENENSKWWCLPLPNNYSLQGFSTSKPALVTLEPAPNHWIESSDWSTYVSPNGMNEDMLTYLKDGFAYCMMHNTSSPALADVSITGDSCHTTTVLRETELWWRLDQCGRLFWREDGQVGLWRADTTNGYGENRNAIENCSFLTPLDGSTIRWGAYYVPDPLDTADWNESGPYFIDHSRFDILERAGTSFDNTTAYLGGIADFHVTPDGTMLFVTDGRETHRYDLPYPWNASVWTYHSSHTLTNFPPFNTPAGQFDFAYQHIEFVYITPRGHYVCYVVAWRDYDIRAHRCYRMSTPFDLSTITNTDWAAADRQLSWHLGWQDSAYSSSLYPPSFMREGKRAWIGYDNFFLWEYDW